MRVLYLMSKAPSPENSGDAIRNMALLRAARSVSDHLHLITLPQAPSDSAPQGVARLRALCDRVDVVGSQPLGHYVASLRNRALAIVNRSYFSAVGSNGGVRRAVRDALRSTRFDCIVVSQLFMASAVPPAYRHLVVYDSHNVHDIRLREALESGRLPQRVVDAIVSRVHREEAALVTDARATVACSELDASILRSGSPGARVETIPNGASPRADGADGRGASSPSVLFLASLDYRANIESLEWFLRHVVPLIDRSVDVRVAGSNPRPVVRSMIEAAARDVHFLGHVGDSAATMRASSVLVVPLTKGSGTRLKVLEAFAQGVPVISTPKGVEGLDVRDGREVVIRESAPALAEAINEVAADENKQNDLRNAALDLLERQYSWPQLEAEFATLLAESSDSGVGREL